MTLLSSSHSASARTGLSRLYDVWRQRQALKTLDDHALEDIGLSYRQARNEFRRPIWDAPVSWMR